MKHLLLALLVLSSIAATAQSTDLFVQPTNPTGSGTDSYVYVNDVVLYVENDINLVRNKNNPDTEASIYLRNDGQLIQGSETAKNKGTGMLSVYQNAPDSDQWTYNYWASPVGVPKLNDNGNKNAGVSRLYGINEVGGAPSVTSSTQANTTGGYNGSSGPPLTISTRWLYMHPKGSEKEGDYDRINANDAVPAGMGFTMKGVDETPVTTTGYTYDFRGRPNTGSIQVEVFADELTLSGNPYPSALDLNRVFYDPDNDEIDRFVYWDEDKTKNSHYYSKNAGGYGTYIPGSKDPDGRPGDSGYQKGSYTVPTFTIWDAAGNQNSDPSATTPGDFERRFAPIGQGFMIVPDNSDDGIVTIKNQHRRFIKEGNDSDFRRPEREDKLSGSSIVKDSGNDNGAVIAEADPRLPQLRINTYFDKSHVRQTLLIFSNESTDFFDRGLDGKSPMDASSESYFPVGPDNDRKPYVINTVPFEAKKLIPIAFKLNKPFKISLETVDEVKMHNKKAYIFDSEQNTYQEFTNGRSATYNLPAGTYDNRFFVTFKGSKELSQYVKATQGRAQEQVHFFQNNPLGVLEVTNPEGYDIEQALVFDMTGKLVYEQQNIGTEKNFSFPTSNLSDGVYIVKLKTTDNIDISYKTSVYNKN